MNCELCECEIEELSEKEAIRDVMGHCCNDSSLAKMRVCYECAHWWSAWDIPIDIYVSGRIEKIKEGLKLFLAHNIFYVKKIGGGLL